MYLHLYSFKINILGAKPQYANNFYNKLMIADKPLITARRLIILLQVSMMEKGPA